MGPLINSFIGRKGRTEWVDYQGHELEAERLIRSNTLYNHQHSNDTHISNSSRGLCGLPITMTFDILLGGGQRQKAPLNDVY